MTTKLYLLFLLFCFKGILGENKSPDTASISEILRTKSPTIGSLLAADGFFYAMTKKCAYKIDINSFRIVWNRRLPGSIEGAAYWRQSLIVNGSFGLKKIDTQTGNVRWSVPVEGGVQSPVACDGETFFFSGWIGSTGAVAATTGTVKWEKEVSERELLGIAAKYGKVIVASLDNGVYCLDQNSGKTLWRFRTKGENWSIPVIQDSISYVGSNDSCLYAIHSITGKTIWERNLHGPVHSVEKLTEDEIYASTLNGLYYFIHSRDGEVRIAKNYNIIDKHYNITDSRSLPLKDGDFLYFGSGWPDNSLYEMSAITGNIRKKWTFKGPVYCTPLKYANYLFLNLNEGFGTDSWHGTVYRIKQ